MCNFLQCFVPDNKERFVGVLEVLVHLDVPEQLEHKHEEHHVECHEQREHDRGRAEQSFAVHRVTEPHMFQTRLCL